MAGAYRVDGGRIVVDHYGSHKVVVVRTMACHGALGAFRDVEGTLDACWGVPDILPVADAGTCCAAVYCGAGAAVAYTASAFLFGWGCAACRPAVRPDVVVLAAGLRASGAWTDWMRGNPTTKWQGVRIAIGTVGTGSSRPARRKDL